MTKRVAGAGSDRINGWRITGWSIAALLLLLPLVAMQFTDKVNWTASDFVFAGVMIGGVGIVFELAVRMTRNRAYRGGVAVALAAAFLLIWINAAVGIIGSENNPLNLVYPAVIAITFIGAVVPRFKARGMARAMAVAASLLALIGVAVLIADTSELPGALGLLMLNGFFATLFTGSAALFRNAARTSETGGA